MENMKLNNNLECPMLGLGTFMLSPEDAYTSTLEALKMGYSLIDTANAYVNERAVGRAIKDSGIDRKNILEEENLIQIVSLRGVAEYALGGDTDDEIKK